MYRYLLIIIISLISASSVHTKVRPGHDIAGAEYARLCREDSREHFPPSLNDQIASYEDDYELLELSDTSGFKSIIDDGFRFFMTPFMGPPLATSICTLNMGATAQALYYGIHDFFYPSIPSIYYRLNREMHDILDTYNRTPGAATYIPFLLTTYFFKLLDVQSPLTLRGAYLGYGTDLFSKLAKMRSLPKSDADIIKLFDPTNRISPEDFQYFYPVLMKNAGFSHETILMEFFKSDHPRSLLPVSLMNYRNIKAHNNIFWSIGGLTAYYVHDSAHSLEGASILLQPSIIRRNENDSMAHRTFRNLFKEPFETLDIVKTRKKNTQLLASELESVKNQRHVIIGLYLLFHEFPHILTQHLRALDFAEECDRDDTFLKVQRLNDLRSLIMNENKSVKYIHPEVFHAARSKAFELLDECGLSREKITSSTPDNIEHEQGSSYTFNITYVHDEGCSTYQIKTAGDCFTECTWVDGKKIPAIPENLLNKNINYKKKLIRIWGGQYADIQGLMHYAETGAFTRGEPCPKADHIIQRSIDVSRQIKRLCIIAIDYAITHHEMSEWLSYQREIHSAIPANEEFEREPN